MKVNELRNIKSLKQITVYGNTDIEINDLYTSDLLSWVMGHVHEEGTLLLTVLNSLNAIAVASLLELSGIVFCEGVYPTEDIIKKAEEEKINLFVSDDTTFHTALAIKEYKS